MENAMMTGRNEAPADERAECNSYSEGSDSRLCSMCNERREEEDSRGTDEKKENRTWTGHDDT